jgi:hypothetical protein
MVGFQDVDSQSTNHASGTTSTSVTSSFLVLGVQQIHQKRVTSSLNTRESRFEAVVLSVEWLEVTTLALPLASEVK